MVNPTTNEIVYSTNLVGFKHNESGSEIIYKFNTPFAIGTNKTSKELEVTLANEIAGSKLEYTSSNENIATITKIQDDGRKIKINGISKGECEITSTL
ncbi:MAG: hypothetical protein MJ223_02845 [Mycoplasmoidaceae bacterium]|nr:hypothetical protein [Mycoplasmoidaceae bacterium]